LKAGLFRSRLHTKHNYCFVHPLLLVSLFQGRTRLHYSPLGLRVMDLPLRWPLLCLADNQP
jgi:hypothetical protein